VQDSGTVGVDNLSVSCLASAVFGTRTVTVGTQVVE
jgi:hypothetical protein